MKIPEQGLSREEVFAALSEIRAGDVDWRSGRAWAYVYDAGPEAEAVCKDAFSSFLSENGLDPTTFPSALRLEREVVRMVSHHVGGGERAVGSFTSGGTESLILAVKTARDWFLERRPGRQAEVVLPRTAHASFQKACHYLAVKPVLVPERASDHRADVEAMARAITEDTALIVGSAPSYAHGVVDPIPELGRLAAERGVLLHVDACIGGVLLPLFRELGRPVPDFDLSVPGVTSLSVDLHKYGFAAKGASVLLFNDPAIRRHQIYACASWSGYTIINTTVQSTKSAGPLAAAWATMRFLGQRGYLDLARKMAEATDRVIAGIRATPGLHVLGDPDSNLVAFASASGGPSVFVIADEMKARGWYVQPQLACPPTPANLHLSINPKALAWVDAFLGDLRDSVTAAAAVPRSPLVAAVVEAASALRPADLRGDGFEQMMGALGLGGSSLPERMAEINEILSALPPELREALLIEYANRLYR
ncbi:MAG: aspartate aminotransferase family protein [Polyangiaceae bacterium]|nr:aspartate aminotransferase family protein [Polyangiaceae bacterium]